jgi:hypothetical protein
MIGSHEYEEETISNNIFIPLLDGSLIRYDQEGFLEKTDFNMRDHAFVDFFKNGQCIVTGHSKTSAIQIDLCDGHII